MSLEIGRRKKYESAMAIETNHVDPVVGGVVSSDDQARRQRTA
jgi:hypothetical protein